jgi:hypothetical protein
MTNWRLVVVDFKIVERRWLFRIQTRPREDGRYLDDRNKMAVYRVLTRPVHGLPK